MSTSPTLKFVLFLLSNLTCCSLLFGQHIEYDTIFQITKHDGIIDSVIIVRKKVMMNKQVYYTSPESDVYKALEVSFSPLIFQAYNKAEAPDTSAFSHSSFKSRKASGSSVQVKYYRCKKNLSIEAGIRLSRFQQKTSYEVGKQYVENRHIQVNDTLDEITNVVGNDTTYTYIIEPKDVYFSDTTNNTYRGTYTNSMVLIGVPIQIGYQKHFKRNGIGVSAGPVVSFLVKRNTESLDQDGSVVRSENALKLSAQFSLNAAVQYEYYLDDNSAITLQSYFEQIPFKNKQSIQPSSVVGIQIGLKYFL